ncbi:MAG: aminoacyl-tRNA hydrolase [Phycisphaerae bacterium]|nr:aminoacyl-tRNA hydrolase [Phycisphaerae bacterium]
MEGQDTKLIVGLGNPGTEYCRTRHNAGFWVIDSVAEKLNIKLDKKKFGAVFGASDYKGKKLILAKPQLFMNRSGQSVATIRGFYRIALENILVISDDMAIDCGAIRLRSKGSAGGQKGLGDIIEKLGSNEFGRLRVGIGSSGQIGAYDYVLGKPDEQQRKKLDEAVEKAVGAVLGWVEEGIEAAMNKFN